MKKILVPTDFSENANVATETAIELAQQTGAEIHFLHSINSPVEWAHLPLEREKLYPEIKEKIGFARNELNKLVERCEKLGIKAKEFLTFDEGREEINEHVSHYKDDFIIMGTYGAKGMKNLIGSNTQNVIRHAHIPVLSLKHRMAKKNMENIVFASDFENESQKAFADVVELARMIDAKIHLLFVNTPDSFVETETMKKKMDEFVKRYALKAYTFNIYDALTIESGILEFSTSIKSDMVALATHGRKGMMNVISPSIAEDLANHSEIPVLSINLKAK